MSECANRGAQDSQSFQQVLKAGAFVDAQMTKCKSPARPASYGKKIALVLQGGGALGSYQAGAYEALASSEYLPDWVAGISIGAINAAIIAGNAPGRRVGRLRSFWEEITAPTEWWPSGLSGPFAHWQQKASALSAVAHGQPGFFAPHAFQDWFSWEEPTSYYDTNALKSTLERLVDFDRINNAKEMRLSVGAVNVRTGRFAYFDSEEIAIRPEHVMARRRAPVAKERVDGCKRRGHPRRLARHRFGRGASGRTLLILRASAGSARQPVARANALGYRRR
jgi:hypothetical protein